MFVSVKQLANATVVPVKRLVNAINHAPIYQCTLQSNELMHIHMRGNNKNQY